MSNEKSGIYNFFDDFQRVHWEDIEINKLEENSKCIYVEFYALEVEYSDKDRELTIANDHMQEILVVDENYDVEIFYEVNKYYPISIAFWKK